MKQYKFKASTYIDPCSDCDLENYCKDFSDEIPNKDEVSQSEDEINDLISECMMSEDINIKLVNYDS